MESCHVGGFQTLAPMLLVKGLLKRLCFLACVEWLSHQNGYLCVWWKPVLTNAEVYILRKPQFQPLVCARLDMQQIGLRRQRVEIILAGYGIDNCRFACR